MEMERRRKINDQFFKGKGKTFRIAFFVYLPCPKIIGEFLQRNLTSECDSGLRGLTGIPPRR